MGNTMPKVNQEYVVEKEKSIVDAAIRVCKTKPAYAVTLRDVVKECGISQGGLYHYFSDIDEIFAEILNRCFDETKGDESEYKIFESNKPLHEIITSAFAIIGQLIDDIVKQYGSLIHEIGSIYLHEPERRLKIADKFKYHNDAELLLGKIFVEIETNIANGDYELLIPKEELVLLVYVTVQGIQQTVTFLQKSDYKENAFGIGDEHKTAKAMMGILAHSVNGMVRNKK